MTDQTQTPEPPAEPQAAEAPKTPAQILYPEAGADEPAKEPPAADPPVEPAKEPAAGDAPKEPDASLAGGTAPEPKIEDYEIRFPENFQVNDELLGEFKKTALEKKIAPADAQAFADLYAKALEGQTAAMQAQHKQAQEAWLGEINQDPLFQGERRTQTLSVLGMAMKEYGSPEAAQILNESGLGNHPAVIRYIYKLAAALTEGQPLAPGRPAGPNGGKKTPSAIDFYPSMQEGASPRTRN